MNPQQLHDCIIKPTLEYMGENYNSIEARFLLLCTAAIESDCGHYIKQVNGPALGIWQMEPDTHDDIWNNCDAIKLGDSVLFKSISNLGFKVSPPAFRGIMAANRDLIMSPMYACTMARLKYSMDPKALPEYTSNSDLDLVTFYHYYKRVYNTELGASTLDKWLSAIERNGILKVDLGES